MPYRRATRRARTSRRSTGRDYFWAAPVQRVGRGGSDFGPFTVSRVGFLEMKADAGTRINYSNGLSKIYSAHGATTYQLEDSREADLRERPWKIHFFEGVMSASISNISSSSNYVRHHVQVRMGAAVAIPREEGVNVPSGSLLPESERAQVEYFSLLRWPGTTWTGPEGIVRRWRRLPISKTLMPDQDWLINAQVVHSEGNNAANGISIGVHGRFRCSRP